MIAPEAGQLATRLRAYPAIARVADALAGTPGCWLVGGAVRDLLLDRTPLDIDVVVEGDAGAAAEEAARRLGAEVRGHERFGTATVAAGDLTFDLVTARRETYPAPGALPEVEPASLEEDLARRDFTVHALALGLSQGHQGQLRAVPGGLADLEARLLRVLHDQSFMDDPTRLLRLVRYAARLGFAVEPGTEALARAAIEAGALATVSGGRIGGELRLLLVEPSAVEALERAQGLGLIRALHPSLRLDAALAAKALTHMPAGARPDLVLLAACAPDFDPDDLRKWLDRLELAAAERQAVMAAAGKGEPLARALGGAERPSQIAALARDRPAEQLALAAAHGAADQVAAWDRELRSVRLEISGADLIAAGVPEGPRVGEGLSSALALKLDGRLSGREAELRAALKAAGAG